VRITRLLGERGVNVDSEAFMLCTSSPSSNQLSSKASSSNSNKTEREIE